jgi:predicted DNA-binding protein
MYYRFNMFLPDEFRQKLEEIADYYQYDKAKTIRILIEQSYEKMQIDKKLKVLGVKR